MRTEGILYVPREHGSKSCAPETIRYCTDMSATASPRVVGGRLAHEVYTRLKAELLSGRYPQGAPLTVTQLRSEYGVSKQPVMEALRALASDRLVQIQPQVGVRVMAYPPGDVAAFLALFAATEGAMAGLAAAHRSEAQLARLEDACAVNEHSTATGDPWPAYRRGNRAIHRIIHEMATAGLVAQISSDLWDLSDFLIATQGHDLTAELTERHHGHRTILEEIRRRDADAARRSMERHILELPIAH